MSAPEEETPRCDVRMVTRSHGQHGQVFTIRRFYINDREYLVPANAEVTIHAKPREVSTLTVTLFPTSIEFESEPTDPA